METKQWHIAPDKLDKQALQEAAALLQNGEAVAFPTETVYGLGADAGNQSAVAKIFAAKGRPADNPLIVHVARVEQLQHLVTEIPDYAHKLLKAFSPGPLTVILKSTGKVAENVSAGLDSVGVRIPDHPVGRALLEEAGIPVAAPSANVSGRPSPTKAQHVHHDLNGRIAGIVDGGSTGIGLESTVVDCTAEIPVVLRPGGISVEEMEQVVGTVMVDPALATEDDKPKAPGMKYIHYAPEAPLWLVNGNDSFFLEQAERLRQDGKKVGLLVSEELAAQAAADNVRIVGSRTDLKTVASNLYDGLRAFKLTDVDIILGEAYGKEGVGHAIMNRLEKAAVKQLHQID